MDQISPPFRIALVALLAVCALWFTVLKPKDPAADSAPLPTAPGTTGLANDVNAATGAAKTSDAANAKVQSATGGTAAPTTGSTTTPTTTATAAKPAATTAKKSDATGAHAAVAGKNGGSAAASSSSKKAATSTDPAVPLLSALDRKKTVVLLFWNSKGSDDRAVSRAVAAMDRRHGRVVVKAVPVAKVGQYESITSGAQVMQAPTALVIGPDRKARAIIGFTTTAELNQAAGDALAAASK